ncbi:unnamed protein product, partial [Mesorhabditis spiculigera]
MSDVPENDRRWERNLGEAVGGGIREVRLFHARRAVPPSTPPRTSGASLDLVPSSHYNGPTAAPNRATKRRSDAEVAPQIGSLSKRRRRQATLKKGSETAALVWFEKPEMPEHQVTSVRDNDVLLDCWETRRQKQLPPPPVPSDLYRKKVAIDEKKKGGRTRHPKNEINPFLDIKDEEVDKLYQLRNSNDLEKTLHPQMQKRLDEYHAAGPAAKFEAQVALWKYFIERIINNRQSEITHAKKALAEYEAYHAANAARIESDVEAAPEDEMIDRLNLSNESEYDLVDEEDADMAGHAFDSSFSTPMNNQICHANFSEAGPSTSQAPGPPCNCAKCCPTMSHAGMQNTRPVAPGDEHSSSPTFCTPDLSAAKRDLLQGLETAVTAIRSIEPAAGVVFQNLEHSTQVDRARIFALVREVANFADVMLCHDLDPPTEVQNVQFSQLDDLQLTPPGLAFPTTPQHDDHPYSPQPDPI